MTVTLPEVVLMKRYRCPFCHRSLSKEKPMVEHMARCWFNPDKKTCKTCAFRRDVYDLPCDVQSGCGCQDGGDAYRCDKGIKLADHGTEIKSGCPSWMSRDDFEEAIDRGETP
jgi:hypothetical protein